MDSGSRKTKKEKRDDISSDDVPKAGGSWAESKKQMKLRKQQKLLREIDKSKLKQHDQDNDTKNYKKKARKDDSGQPPNNEVDGVTTSLEPAAKGRAYTVSIAVAGSIMDNAQTPPLKAYLAGQVARAAAIYRVDEVIVFDDTGGHGAFGCEQMARLLQFLECPQYLRKHLFPIHPDLQYAGLIAPVDAPHHLRRTDALPFREGVVSSKSANEGSLVNVGLDRDCHVSKKLFPGLRVTVKFEDPSPTYILKPKGKLRGDVVSPQLPRREAGLYWGFTVRISSCLSKVFTECPFKEGYDKKMGTSERGSDYRLLEPQPFNHLLVVFGGVQGLEYALENDETLGDDDVSRLFDHYVNTCPSQGSNTIRTEEAILISMSSLSQFIHK